MPHPKPKLPGREVPNTLRRAAHIRGFEGKLTILNRKGWQRGKEVVLEPVGETTLWEDLSEIGKKEGWNSHSIKLAELNALRRRINDELAGSTVPEELRPKPGERIRISYHDADTHFIIGPDSVTYGEVIVKKPRRGAEKVEKPRFVPIFEIPIASGRLGEGNWVGNAQRLRSKAAASDVLAHFKSIYDPGGMTSTRQLRVKLRRQVPTEKIRALNSTVMSLDPETQDAFREHVRTRVSSRDHAGDLLEAVSRHRSAVVSAILRNAAIDKSREHRGAVARIFAEADTPEAAYSRLSSYKREHGL